MKKTLKLIAIAMSLTLCFILLVDSLDVSIAREFTTRESISRQHQTPETVEAIAHELTVRLLGNYVAGSGVIIGHQGSTYQVLTCDHVIALDPSETFTVLTPDGAEYSASRSDRFNFANLDLAIVEFTSSHNYAIATLGADQPLSLMQPIYVAGFPNSQKNLDILDSTLDLGIQAYFLSRGWVSLLLNHPLEQGYQIGINNEIYIGMSGGPVFNQTGELVGIIGRTKYAFGGIEAYRFADGSEPSLKLLEQMRSASWAIPISGFLPLS